MFKKLIASIAVAAVIVASLGLAASAAPVQPTAPTRGRVVIPALTQVEATDLQFMREEEKLARDVYALLFVQWPLPVFENIAASEQEHMDAVATLLVRYNVADPAADKAAGEFANADLQALYDTLVAQGSESLAAALKVGGTIEETDIIDLEACLVEAVQPDIVQVYQHLENGSENHLRAFVSALLAETGETYAPQLLDQAVYDAILAGTNENGGGGTDGGNGSGGGKGGRP